LILNIKWQSLTSSNKHISIIEHIENNSNFYKKSIEKKLIDFSSNIYLKDKNLYQSFQYKNCYNLWQMSLINEKSFLKTPEIIEAIKLDALINLILSKKPKLIEFEECSKKSSNAIKKICDFYKVKYKFDYLKSNQNYVALFTLNFKRIHSFVWLTKTLFQSLFLKRDKSNIKIENDYIIIDYFTHLNKNFIDYNKYSSKLWDDVLKNVSKKIKFLHIYTKSNLTNNVKDAHYLINKINSKNEPHLFLNSFLTIKIYLKILTNYILIQKKAFLLKKIIKKLFRNDMLFSNLIPLKKHIYSSLYGVNCIENIYWIEIFDSIFKEINIQKKGFYVQENQGWEYALLNAWGKYDHGELFAAQVSPVAFWDLRYLYPFKNILNKPFGQKTPDKYLINSFNNKKTFIDYGYKEDELHVVEALRYKKLLNSYNLKKRKSKKILVIGSILEKTNLELLDVLDKVKIELIDYDFSFKPHPASITSSNIKSKFQKIESSNLEEIFTNYDCIICPCDSGASIDCYLLNANFIVYINKGSLNTSPLKGILDDCFVKNSNSIIEFIKKNKKIIHTEKLLHFSDDDKEWRKIIT